MRAGSIIRLLRRGAAILLLAPAVARAGFIATDGFDSCATGAVTGQGAAASGWAGAWAAGSGIGLNSEIVDTSVSGAMSFTPTGGTAISGGRRALEIYPPAGVGGNGMTGITATRQLFTPQTGTFYVAYAIKWQSGVFNTNDTFAIHLTDSATDVDRGFNFGYRGLPGTYGVMCRKGTGNPVAGAFVNFSGNTTVRYLVAKFEKVASANYNKITVWLNPDVTSEVDLPNGNCQLTGIDSGVATVSSVNLRVENLKGPDATSNGDDRVRMDSLTLATSFSDVTLNVNPGPRPFIWVRDLDKAPILARIAGNAWATSVYNGMVSRVAADVASHQSNRDAFLRQLPVDWTLVPAKFKTIPAYPESSVRYPAEAKFNDALDCAVLYYLTGDAKYAQCAADILHNAVKTLLPVATSTDTGNGGWIFQDDFLKEARVTGPQLPIIYDLLHSWLQANQVYDVQTVGMVSFNFTNGQGVFRTLYELARDHGQKESNWSALMSTTMLNNLLALDSATERATALQVYLVTGTSKQASLDYDYRVYTQPGDIWPESLQYAGDVGQIRSTHLVLLERVDPNLALFDAYPNLPLSLPRISYLRYPNGQQISFGDGHRDADGQPFSRYELVYQHAKARGRTDLTSFFGSLINGGVAASQYNRSTLNAYDPLSMHDDPLQLLWQAASVSEPGVAPELPRTDTLAHAGIALQRNLSTNNNPTNAFMAFAGGAGHVHSHASGMSMELYGLGQVMGTKSGRDDYGTTLHENYYRLFASNNTVIVNGASRGEGGWENVDINTVQTVAMEPNAFQPAVSPDVSFTCSSFLDNKGTLAEGTQQRTLAIVRTSPATGYYVDIFRSKSSVANQFHDYIYHNIGTTLTLESNAATLPLTTAPTRFQTDIGDAYQQPGWRYFTNTMVSSATANAVRGRFTGTPTGNPTLHMDLHIPGATGREYSTVSAPAIVDAPAPFNSQLSKALVVRQPGEAWDRPFAVVFEPHTGTATSGTVTNVTKLEKSGVLVGLKVESTVAAQNIVQYILSNDAATDTCTDDALGIAFTGRFAVITDKGNGTGSLYVGDGTSLQYQGRKAVSQSGANTQFNVAFTTSPAPTVTTNAPLLLPPTISAIADQTLPLNSGTAAIPFTLGDLNSAATSLQISVASSNTQLVPLSSIVIGGSGANRTVTVTPALMQTGAAILTLTVSDGTLTSTETFLVTVDELPFGRFAYLFNYDANFEGWTANAAATGATVSAGALSTALSGSDPQFTHPAVLDIAGDNVPVVLVRMKSSAGGSAQLFFGNELGGYSAANSVSFAVPAGSVYKWYAVNVAANTNWTGHTIKALRLDPPSTTGTVSIDAIIGSDGDFNQDGIPDLWEVTSQLDPTTPADAQRDSDNDGITDLLEYATAMNPGISDSVPVSTAKTSTTLDFVYRKNNAATGLTYTVEWTDTLTNDWSSAGISAPTILSDNGTTQQIKVTVTAGGGVARRFVRLRVQPN